MAIKIELLVDDKGTAVVKRATSQMTRSIKDVETQSTRTTGVIGASWSKLAGVIAGVFSVSAISSFAKGIINYADQLQNLNTRLGVSVTEMDKLRQIAYLNDIEFNKLTEVFSIMSRNISEARKGTGDQAEAFRRLGISVSDLMRMTPDKQFVTIGEALNQILNPTTKMTLAMQIFGRGAAEIIQMLPNLRKNLEDTNSEFSASRVKQLAEFNTRMKELKIEAENLGIKVLPALNNVLDFMNQHFTAISVAIGSILGAGLLKWVGGAVISFGTLIGLQKQVTKEISSVMVRVRDGVISSEPYMQKVTQTARWFTLGSAILKVGGIIAGVVAAIAALGLAIDELIRKLIKLQQGPNAIPEAEMRDKVMREMMKEPKWSTKGMTSLEFKEEFNKRLQNLKAQQDVNRELDNEKRKIKENTDLYQQALPKVIELLDDEAYKTEEQRKLLEKLNIETLSLVEGELEAKRAALDAEYEANKKILGDMLELRVWYNAQREKLDEQFRQREIQKFAETAATQFPEEAYPSESRYTQIYQLQTNKDKIKQISQAHMQEMRELDIEYFRLIGKDREADLLELQTWYEKQLELHKDNAEAKARIEEIYAEKIRLINDELYKSLKEIAKIFQEQLTDALTELIMGTKTAKEAFRDLLEYIAREFLRRGIMKLIEILMKYIEEAIQRMQSIPSFGGGGGGGGFNWAATIAGTAAAANSMGWLGMQHGGPVSAYKPYMVGEAGPELFMPRTSGSIVPNDQLGRGGGRDIVINSPITINNNGGSGQTDPKEVERTSRIYKKMLKDSVKEVIMEEQRPMGLLNR